MPNKKIECIKSKWNLVKTNKRNIKKTLLYICENCGGIVGKNDNECPNCEAYFLNMKNGEVL